MNNEKHYYGVDWLRSIACICIVMMHMISKKNNQYDLKGYFADTIIPSFTDFVFLFMTISGFVLFFRYYTKFMRGEVNWSSFYKKRYLKILPFFSVVVFIDIVIKHDVIALIEAVPNLTLTRGFFPNNIGQIGVGWFLGLIFVFYTVFPLLCTFMSTKRNAWILLVVSMLLNYVVDSYYEMGRENIIYSLPFFVIGGLIYLYKDSIEKVKTGIWLAFSILSVIIYYTINYTVLGNLLLSSTLLMLAVSIDNGFSKIISFISEISMEIYLSHMVIFRLVEKLHLNYILGKGWLQYLCTVMLTFCGAVVFSVLTKKMINMISDALRKERKNHNEK